MISKFLDIPRLFLLGVYVLVVLLPSGIRSDGGGEKFAPGKFFHVDEFYKSFLKTMLTFKNFVYCRHFLNKLQNEEPKQA